MNNNSLAVLLLLIFSLLVLGCNRTAPTLLGIFWNPPADIGNLYRQGGQNGRVPDLCTECETVAFEKGDTSYRATYKGGKVVLIEIEFTTVADPVGVMNSLVQAKHLQFERTDSNEALVTHKYYHDKSHYTFILQNNHMKIRQLKQE